MDMSPGDDPPNLVQNHLSIGFVYLTMIALLVYWFYDFFRTNTPRDIVLYIRTCRVRRLVHRILFEIPRRWFRYIHTYALVLQFAVLLSVISIYSDIALFPGTWVVDILKRLGQRELTVSSTTTLLAIGLYFIHLCRRWYEVMFVSTYADTKMCVLDYVAAYLHYTAIVMCLIGHSPKLANGTNSLNTPEWEDTSLKLNHIGILEIAGIAVFIWANRAQYTIHVELANLRVGKDMKNAKTSHFIPRGKYFTRLSCPNILAELAIYVSLCAMQGFLNKSLNYCTFWVASRQILTALVKHKWYITTFYDYPTERYAIIPNFL